ncbi:hypothetical protein [Jiella pelagia]|uniref:Uncharacterized protein n=1 Tax=Jiella pelagia TaxID=2986949 RepID=A0ABY7C2B8_9HYPH|nr:hypothetical protein [Jiella pelagia]WAP70237.1 hypothetical protein OH818_09100 [Jiella pelagia]
MQDRTEPTAFASRGIVFQAVAAGVFVAAVVQITATLAGFGLIDLYATGRGAPVVSAAAAFWIAVVALAFVIGGFASARLADARQLRDAMLCGLLTFSTALIAAIVILTLRPPALVDRSLGPVGNVAATLAMAGSASMPGAPAERSVLRGDVLTFLDTADAYRGTAGRAARPESGLGSGAALATILAGIAETADEAAVAAAVSTIQSAVGVTEEVAERRLTDWQRANDRALRDSRRSAAAATSAVSAGCFSAFVALFAAMLAAMLGGVLGRPRDSMLEIGAKWS